MNLCVDCIHHRGRDAVYVFGGCLPEIHHCLRERRLKTSLVTGRVCGESSVHDCELERSLDSRCGPEGKYYRARTVQKLSV